MGRNPIRVKSCTAIIFYLYFQEEDSVIRSCAYCLNVCGVPTKLCGGYLKSPYGSKECQNQTGPVKETASVTSPGVVVTIMEKRT